MVTPSPLPRRMSYVHAPYVYFHLRSLEEISKIDLNLCLPASSFHIRENMESVADLEDKKTNFQPWLCSNFPHSVIYSDTVVFLD